MNAKLIITGMQQESQACFKKNRGTVVKGFVSKKCLESFKSSAVPVGLSQS